MASRVVACGYCLFPFEADKTKRLPLQCRICNRLFHLECLNCDKKPTALYGDQLFDFYCSYCSGSKIDSWKRLDLNWSHVIHLALYNLIITSEGRNGFFRWNKHICKYIQSHWFDLMPCRNKTSSWNCTVAGTLSSNCPNIFRSGTDMFKETGWWSLKEIAPPNLKDVLKALSGTERAKKGSLIRKQVQVDETEEDIPSTSSHIIPDQRLRSKKRPLEQNTVSNKNKKAKEEPLVPPVPSLDSSQSLSSSSKLNPLTPRQEVVLLNAMCSLSSDTMDHATRRFLRKLKVRQLKRDRGCPVFSLDNFVRQSLVNTEHYTCSDAEELPRPLMSAPVEDTNTDSEEENSVGYSMSTISKATAILRRLDNPYLPVLVPQLATQDKFISPYTSHYLMPHIFVSDEFCPPKIQIFQELMSKRGSSEYKKKPLTFSYFREHHLSSVNALISYFFWPVDLTEYLQYPDFTVVVLYGDKLCIGCGFMTPDVSISEAYIPFLLVHPDFRCSNIGQIMLYHLIQSCQGKDVILHVSVNNPAMLLYQKFGFKAEQFCIDFYDKYYPPKYHLSKHAFLMRLKR